MKNTLVTIGCSITEGQGCWGNYKKLINTQNELHTQKEKYLDRFREFGWPNLVGKKLGFDKVINLGKIGSSTSGQLKHFMEIDFEKNQNIYVIWMLTEPTRFSFYSNGMIKDINPGNESELGSAYLNSINNVILDACMEQLFYVKCMREICENRGFKLLITYWNTASIFTQRFDETNDNYLFDKPKNIYPIKNSCFSMVDGHPNEKGYFYMSEKIVEQILKYNNNFKVGTSKDNIDYETYDLKKHKLK